MAKKQSSFDKLVELKGAALKTMVDDYTYWDEMANFTYFKQPQWAKENIDEVLSSFGVNAAWVYATDFSLIYSTNNIDDNELKELPSVPKKLLYDYFLNQKKHFLHFFASTKKGLLEIRAASIHPTADPERITPPRGYFFVAKLWDPDYFHELSDLTESRISLNLTSGSIDKQIKALPEKGIIQFSKTLPKWDGNGFAWLDIETDSESIISFNKMSQRYLTFFVVFTFLTILIIFACIIKWVSKPLYFISKALSDNKIDSIRPLLNNQSEFGEISRMIEKFIQQREALLEEINERKKIENALRVSKENFHNIVDRSPEGILIVDTNNIIRFINNAGEQLLNNNNLLNRPFLLIPDLHKKIPIDLSLEKNQSKTGEVVSTKTEWDNQDAYLIIIRDITKTTT